MNGRTKVPDSTAEQQPAKGQRKDMRRKNKKIDMLNGSIWDKMIVFALPLAFTGMLQQLFNAADVAVLGRFVSNESMAGVGNNVPVIGLIIAFCMGLALGANVVVARLLGMKEPERANRAVHTALATAVIFGIGAAIVGECFAGPAMDWLSVPEAVMRLKKRSEAASALARTVASATPAVPMPKASTKKRLPAMLTRVAATSAQSGVCVSPWLRITAARKL